MKKTIVVIVSVILLLVFLDRCTTINISTAFLSSKYKAYPELRQGVSSKNFELRHIDSILYCGITYDPVYHFFLIDNGYAIHKIDAKGNEVFKLEQGGLNLLRFTHYAVDSTGIYDLSKDKVARETFKSRINVDQKLKKEAWEKIFAQYYKEAQTVVYGNYSSDGNPIYLKINEDWILIKTNTNDNRIVDEDQVSEVTFEGYPAKYNPLYLLKDVKNLTYSNNQSTTDEFLNTYYTVKLKEKELEYPADMALNLQAFQKEGVGFRAAYSGLPLSWALTAYYEINRSGEKLNFKTYANQYIGLSKPVDTYLTLFTVPQKFRSQTAVSFLKYKLTTVDETQVTGYFILKNK